MSNKIAIFEDLAVGQFAERTVLVTAEAIQKYTALTGDTNFIHTDPERAAAAGFDGCVAHGALICGYVGALIGTELPGEGSVVVQGSFQCVRPIMAGAEIYIRVEIADLDPKGLFGQPGVTMKYQCSIHIGGRPRGAGGGHIMVVVPRRKS